MGGESNTQTEYVEPSQHDMRRVKNIAGEMASKLEKQQEENKNQLHNRRSLRSHRQSILLTSSFAPMKPIVVTKEIITQTESEPLKQYGTIETQTESVETVSTRMQTDNAELKDSTMQTHSTLTDSVEIQTEKPESCV